MKGREHIASILNFQSYPKLNEDSVKGDHTKGARFVVVLPVKEK